jgi:hypothetical protein
MPFKKLFPGKLGARCTPDTEAKMAQKRSKTLSGGPKTTPESAKTDAPNPQNDARNGKSRIAATDGRTALAKRHKAIAEALIGNETLDFPAFVMADVAALAILRCEQVKARIMAGDETVEDEQVVRLMNAVARALAMFKTKKAKPKREATDLKAYVDSKKAAA